MAHESQLKFLVFTNAVLLVIGYCMAISPEGNELYILLYTTTFVCII